MGKSLTLMLGCRPNMTEPKHIGFLPKTKAEEAKIERAAKIRHWSKSKFAYLATLEAARRLIAKESSKTG